MKILKRLATILLLAAVLLSCNKKTFITVENGKFIKNGMPYYFLGTNFWYGVILASEGEGGDRERLKEELDNLHALGLDNLRILVGADGVNGTMSKVEPTLQTAPGVYNDTLLQGLDYLLVEMGKRNMEAVLYLNNSWEWSGGYGQYLEWAGYGAAPIPALVPYETYCDFVAQFPRCEKAKAMFDNHVKFIVSRTNSITGKPYSEDRAIMSWQICNEPRAFSRDSADKVLFSEWLQHCAKLIKSIDPNHLVSTGSEGYYGSEKDLNLWLGIGACPEIDYLNLHIWPLNWGWVTKNSTISYIDSATYKSFEYLDMHLRAARAIQKPLVCEEFGYPRDGGGISLYNPVHMRDVYYKDMFERLENSASSGDILAGMNFWTWGGSGKPDHAMWTKGDPYVGDPAQEPQGLNSVFITDESTLEIIRNTTSKLQSEWMKSKMVSGQGMKQDVIGRLNKLSPKGSVLFGHQDSYFYGHDWEKITGPDDLLPLKSDIYDVCEDYPAILGCDLGELELGNSRNIDGVPFEMIAQAIEEQHRRGGISAISWHARNPQTGGDAWDISDNTTVASILPGGERHDEFIEKWLNPLATFLQTIRDDKGMMIPVIFRPWHENTGSWFWWGKDMCSPEQYKMLFDMTHDYLVSQRGLTELIWAYSPSYQSDEWKARYPGDPFVDIVGLDIYQEDIEKNPNAYRDFRKNLEQCMKEMEPFAVEHGKLLALTEVGNESVKEGEWWTEILHKAVKDHKICYVLVWRNAYDKPTHFFAPYPGQESAENFIEFYKLPNIIFLDEFKRIR